MATREQIRTAFYDELESAVPTSGNDGHVPADHIKQERPESTEELPALVHDDAYRKRPINQASTAPIDVKRDNNDDATAETYGTLHEARFSLLLFFTDEAEKERCYEAVRTYFEKFEHGPWPASDIQSDVEWVRVRDAQSDDDTDMNPVRRGDRLLVSVVFMRTMDDTGTAIQQASHEVDANNDGVTDATWTST